MNTAPNLYGAIVNKVVTQDRATDIVTWATDADGDAMTYTFSAPVHGTLARQGSPMKVTYYPPRGYLGPDSFMVTVDDGRGGVTRQTYALNVVPARAGSKEPDFGGVYILGQASGPGPGPAPAAEHPLIGKLRKAGVDPDRLAAAMKG